MVTEPRVALELNLRLKKTKQIPQPLSLVTLGRFFSLCSRERSQNFFPNLLFVPVYQIQCNLLAPQHHKTHCFTLSAVARGGRGELAACLSYGHRRCRSAPGAQRARAAGPPPSGARPWPVRAARPLVRADDAAAPAVGGRAPGAGRARPRLAGSRSGCAWAGGARRPSRPRQPGSHGAGPSEPRRPLGAQLTSRSPAGPAHR